MSNVHETSEMEFLSTPSARRATCCTLLAGTPFTYFYPRPPRGGRLSLWLSMSILPKISIHALREEGDRAKLRFPSTGEPFLSTPSARRATQRIPDNLFFVCDFYPRPPRGGRLDRGLCIRGTCAFLSTPSARRATCFASGLAVLAEYFYPRPPRGGRLASSCLRILLLYFYPRPPRGGRHAKFYIEMAFRKFLSTPSARRATDVAGVGHILVRFLSTPSARRATTLTAYLYCFKIFLSTPSARRATSAEGHAGLKEGYFYPRPPRGGRPEQAAAGALTYNDFYPRPPRGGRLQQTPYVGYPYYISIHALREEGDRAGVGQVAMESQFLSTPSARRATP